MRIVILLVPLFIATNAIAGEKPKPAERPTFLYAAPVTGFSAGDDKHEFRLEGPGVALSDAIYAEIPAKQSPGFVARRVLGVEGDIGTKKVTIGFAGKSPLTAGAFMIHVKKFAFVDDKNKADYPPKGAFRIIGLIVAGKFPLGKEEAAFAIANGTEPPIRLTGKLPEELAAGQRVRADGALRALPGAILELRTERLEIDAKK